MKKLISAVLSGVMLASVFLCGCNTIPGEQEATETETTAEATAVETEPEPPHIDVERVFILSNCLKAVILFSSMMTA